MGMMWGGGGGLSPHDGLGGQRWKMRELAQREHWDWPVVKRALSAFAPYWRRALAVAAILVATSIGAVLPAWLTRQIIDVGIGGRNVPAVIWFTVTLIGVSLVSGLLGVWQTWLGNLMAQDVMADYRLALFRHIQRQSMNFFARSQSGELVSRVMNDVAAIQNVVTNTLVGMVSNTFLIIATLALMFSMNWQMALLSLVIVPTFVIPTQRVGRVRQRLQGQIQESLSRLTIKLTEQFGVSGALLTRIFHREDHQERHFTEINTQLRDLQVRQNVVGRWLFMWLGLFSSVGPAALWGYGAWLVIHGRMGIGTIVAFTALLGRLYGPLSQLAQVHVGILSSIALFRRIFALQDMAPDIVDGPTCLPQDAVRGHIRFEGVYFAYDGERSAPEDDRAYVLQDVELDIAPGQLVALVGPSGAGKTSLLHLIPRFADPTRGRVLFDGHDCRELTLGSLRTQIGLVPQDPFFFHDTIRNNLLYARPNATESAMREACAAAQIDDLLAGMPDGLDTLVGERGYRLSGGERQRLAIARVMLQAPRVVLLDEATSALDTLVERRIQLALGALLAGRTAIVIAHRLSTILSADNIVVLENGRVAGTGVHGELLETSPLYRQLYEAQFVSQEPLPYGGRADEHLHPDGDLHPVEREGRVDMLR